MAKDKNNNEEPLKKGNAVRAMPEQITAFEECIVAKVETFKIKGRKNKQGAIIVQIAIIVFSAATTIFIGWKTKPENVTLVNFALVCSAVTTGLTMLYNFFDYKDLWVQYKTGKNEFESLLAEVKYYKASGITKQQLDALFAKYSDISNNVNTAYKQIRMAKDSTTEKDK